MRNLRKISFAGGCFGCFAVSAVEAYFATAENYAFQFCTTKAYGVPFPWRIDFCPCEDSAVVYPAFSYFGNLALVAVGGFLCFALVGGLGAWLRHIWGNPDWFE